ECPHRPGCSNEDPNHEARGTPPHRSHPGHLSARCREIRIVLCTSRVSCPAQRKCGCDTSGSPKDGAQTNSASFRPAAPWEFLLPRSHLPRKERTIHANEPVPES